MTEKDLFDKLKIDYVQCNECGEIATNYVSKYGFPHEESNYGMCQKCGDNLLDNEIMI